MERADIGGVHIKYLHHCRRQLWLYARGVRPEQLSSRVQLGEAVHETSYKRSKEVDLGAARLDHLDGALWVHETKSSAAPTKADEAQAMYYCHLLRQLGVPAQGAILRYPKTRRKMRIPYDSDREAQTQADMDEVLATIATSSSPERLPRKDCRGCSFLDYCWTD